MDFYTLDPSSVATDQREDLLIRCRDNLKVLNSQLDEERELRRIAEKEAQNLRFELLYFEEKLSEYEAKHYAHSSDITVYEQENKDLKKELHFINLQLKEAQQDRDTEKARADVLSEDLENLQRLFEESKAELEHKQASLDEWQNTLTAVESQLRSLADENQNLSEDVARYKVQYDTILEQTHNLQNTIQILQEENQALQDRLAYSDNSIVQQKNTMQIEIQKALEKIKAAHSEQEALWREEINASVRKLQGQVDESRMNLTNVEQDRNYLQDKVYKLKEKKRNLLNISVMEKHTLESELEQLRNEINAHRNMLQSQNGIKDTMKTLERQLQESRIENEKSIVREKTLNEQCTHSYNTIQTLKTELREKDARIQHFEQRLSELQQKLRNIEFMHENEINEQRKAFIALAKEYEQEKLKAKQDSTRAQQNSRAQEEFEKLKSTYHNLQLKRNEEIQNLNKDRERLQSLVIELQKQLEFAGTEIRQIYHDKSRRTVSLTDLDTTELDAHIKRLTKENFSLKQDLTSKQEELDSKESELSRIKDSFKKRLSSRILECEDKVSKWREKFLEELGYIQRWMESLRRDRAASGVIDKLEGMINRLDTVLSCTYNIEYSD
jgi:chromosome segregation ATPase